MPSRLAPTGVLLVAAALPAAALPSPPSVHAAQDFTPIKAIEMYLDGFHVDRNQRFLPAARQTQVRVAHYCVHQEDDLIQCVLFDGNSVKARMIGVEYVITHDLYRQLPRDERSYWHPHDSEVDAGLLRLPGLPAEQEEAILGFVRSTWGKTWHTWDVPRQDQVPMGRPALMWSVDPKRMTPQTKQAMERRISNFRF